MMITGSVLIIIINCLLNKYSHVYLGVYINVCMYSTCIFMSSRSSPKKNDNRMI
jgi:hypothetical protein